MPSEVRVDRKTATVLVLVLILCVPAALRGQQPPPLEDTIEAGDDEVGTPEHNLVKWNEFDGKYSTFRFGAGFLYEYAAYSQNGDSKEQIELHPMPKLRDARFLFRGRL